MGVDVEKLSSEEGARLFDRAAQRTFGISGDEWLRRWNAGEYHLGHDHPQHLDIARVAALLPFAARAGNGA